MSQNPFQSPQVSGGVRGIPGGRRRDLRDVAKYQKGILMCILAYLCAVILSPILGRTSPGMAPLIGLAVLAVMITATVFVFLLATRVYGTGLGILLGVLTLFPCLGLIVLLVINGKATSILRNNGVSVGLLGANLNRI